MLRTILVDDKLENLQVLQHDLRKYCAEDISIIESCQSPLKALKAIRNQKPDLVFLDIQMEGYDIDGFELLNILGTIDFAIIFVTAFEKYALKAFEVEAIGYLTKPFSSEALIKVVNRAKQWSRKDIETLGTWIHQIRDSSTSEKLRFPVVNGYLFKGSKEIVYCTADKAVSKMYFSDNSSTVIHCLIKVIEATLPSTAFFRIHHSYLVGKKYVERFRNNTANGGGEVILSNGEKLPVSRAKKKEFLLWMNQES